MSVRAIVYGTGTPYTLTPTPAKVAFGTTSPVVHFTAPAGTKRALRAQATIELVGATFDAERTITIKLRKISGTPSDVPNAEATFKVGVAASPESFVAAVVALPPVIYTISTQQSAGLPETIEMWASIDWQPIAGSVQISAAWLEVD